MASTLFRITRNTQISQVRGLQALESVLRTLTFWTCISSDCRTRLGSDPLEPLRVTGRAAQLRFAVPISAHLCAIGDSEPAQTRSHHGSHPRARHTAGVSRISSSPHCWPAKDSVRLLCSTMAAV